MEAAESGSESLLREPALHPRQPRDNRSGDGKLKIKSDGGCKNAAAAVNFRLKSLAEFFAAHGEKSILSKNLWFLGKQNKTERSPAPFRYMVEDKMKKMKNCYLQLLIYPKDVSY